MEMDKSSKNKCSLEQEKEENDVELKDVDEEEEEEEQQKQREGSSSEESENQKDDQSSSSQEEMKSLLDPEQIIRMEMVGAGSYGEVWKATYNGQIVAIKIPYDSKKKASWSALESMKASHLSQKLGDIESVGLRQLRKEAQVLTSKRHPHVLMMMGFCISNGGLCIVTEFCSYGDLKKYFAKHKNIPLLQMCEWRVQVAQGMRWLHGNPCVLHLDLKLDNIFLDINLKAKIGDFGIASITKQRGRLRKSKAYDPVGNMLHEAPEVMEGWPFDSKADVYGFGILCWEISYGREWDADFTDQELENNSVDKLIRLFEKGVISGVRRPNFYPQDEKLNTFLETCWSRHPSSRPTFQELVPILKELTMVTIIKIEPCVKFWLESFGSVIQVKFEDFLGCFQQSSLVKSEPFTDRIVWALHRLLQSGAGLPVGVQSFGRFARAFLCLTPVSPSIFTEVYKSPVFSPFGNSEDVYFLLEKKTVLRESKKETGMITYAPVDEHHSVCALIHLCPGEYIDGERSKKYQKYVETEKEKERERKKEGPVCIWVMVDFLHGELSVEFGDGLLSEILREDRVSRNTHKERRREEKLKQRREEARKRKAKKAKRREKMKKEMGEEFLSEGESLEEESLEEESESSSSEDENSADESPLERESRERRERKAGSWVVGKKFSNILQVCQEIERHNKVIGAKKVPQ